MIQEIIAKTLGINQNDIELKHDLVNDLGADSLNIVEIIMELEEEYNIEIPDEDAEELTTVQSIIEYIEQQWHAHTDIQ